MALFIFGVDQLAADVQADLTGRSFSPAPQFYVGEWNTETHYGSTRVVFGRGRGRIEDPTGDTFASSGWIDTGDGSGTVARALLHRRQTFLVWCHGVAPPNTAPAARAQAARQATDALLDAVLAAIRRTRGGMVTGWSDVEPLNEARGGFVYGSVVTFGVEIAVPVWDDETPVFQASSVEADASVTVDGVDTPTSPEVAIAP
jgi:hypothetical protein